MVGLGEEWDEIISVMQAIRGVGCDILTLGQYLSPRRNALPIQRYYTPEDFTMLKAEGERMGFKHVESGSARAEFLSRKGAIGLFNR